MRRLEFSKSILKVHTQLQEKINHREKCKTYFKGPKECLEMKMVENSLLSELAKYRKNVFAKIIYHTHQYV